MRTDGSPARRGGSPSSQSCTITCSIWTPTTSCFRSRRGSPRCGIAAARRAMIPLFRNDFRLSSRSPNDFRRRCASCAANSLGCRCVTTTTVRDTKRFAGPAPWSSLQRVEASINPIRHGRCEARCGERPAPQPMLSPRRRRGVGHPPRRQAPGSAQELRA